MPAAGPWEHKEQGGARISSGTAQATQGKHPRAPKSSANPQTMALLLPITFPAVSCCNPALPTPAKLQWVRKGRGRVYREKPQLGSSWGGFRKVYSVQNPSTSLLQSVRSEIWEPRGPTRVGEEECGAGVQQTELFPALVGVGEIRVKGKKQRKQVRMGHVYPWGSDAPSEMLFPAAPPQLSPAAYSTLSHTAASSQGIKIRAH